MAQSARFVPEGTIVCPAMDARRSQLYNALFTVHNGVPVRLTEDRAIAAAALAEELSGSGKRVWILGDGWAIREANDPAVPLSGYTIEKNGQNITLPKQPLAYLEWNRIYSMDIYFYLEGCDPDCSDAVSFDGADIHLAFYGVLAE